MLVSLLEFKRGSMKLSCLLSRYSHLLKPMDIYFRIIKCLLTRLVEMSKNLLAGTHVNTDGLEWRLIVLEVVWALMEESPMGIHDREELFGFRVKSKHETVIYYWYFRFPQHFQNCSDGYWILDMGILHCLGSRTASAVGGLWQNEPFWGRRSGSFSGRLWEQWVPLQPQETSPWERPSFELELTRSPLSPCHGTSGTLSWHALHCVNHES